MSQYTDIPHPPSRAARAAAEGMEITGPRLEALRAVDGRRVQFDSTTGVFMLDGEHVTGSTRRTYGDVRRRQLIQEGTGPGVVDVRLTPAGQVVLDDYREEPAQPGDG